MKVRSVMVSIVLATVVLNHDFLSAQEAVQEMADGLKIGAKLPDLTVKTQDGKEIPLAAAKDHQWVFVFFYPKAMTGG